jgi:hypothetical protein
LAGLEEHKRGGGREQVPAAVRARILALTRTTPPVQTGLSHWSSREMARHVSRTEGVMVSWHYVAKLWRDHDLQPHQQGTFKLSRDPRFAEKVADIVGLYLDPPGGAAVLSIDEKPRSRPWTARNHCCHSTSACPSSAPTTTNATASPTCSPRWTPAPAR